jgi:hypothetical protein
MNLVNIFRSSPNVRTLLVFVAGMHAATPVFPAYTILDEDPTTLEPLQGATHSAATAATTALIPFAVSRSTFGPRGARAMNDALIAARTAQTIVIVSRSDASDKPALREQRAHAMEQWLISNKIPKSRIRHEQSVTPLPDKVPGVYFSELRFVSETAPIIATSSETRRTQQHKDIQSLVLDLHKRGQITSDEALRLLSSPSQATRAGQFQTPTTLPGTTQAIRTWKLPAGATLRDAISAWAEAAGWNSPQWLARDPYYIDSAHAIRSDFIKALSDVAEAVPSLDFHVSRRARSFTVSDRCS